MMRSVALLSAVTLLAGPAVADSFSPAEKVGDTYEIRLEAKGEAFGQRGSSRSSTTGDYVERVVAVGATSIDLEFDFPENATAERRAGEWRLPARVRKDRDGAVTLVNAAELQARGDAWLKHAGYTKSDCGRRVTTTTQLSPTETRSNIVTVLCDPQSVMTLVNRYDLRFSALHGDGGDLTEAGAEGLVYARRQSTSVYVAIAQVDREIVRRRFAEDDVRAAEARGAPKLLLEDALKARAGDRITGALSIRYEADGQGQVTRKQKTTVYTVERPDGEVVASTETETMTRRRISP